MNINNGKVEQKWEQITVRRTEKTTASEPSKQSGNFAIVQVEVAHQRTGKQLMAAWCLSSQRFWGVMGVQFGWDTQETVALMLLGYMAMAMRPTRYIYRLEMM
jgi:hypothetical protein